MSFLRDEYILSNKGQTIKRGSDLSAVTNFLGTAGEEVKNFKEGRKKKKLEEEQTQFLKDKGSDYSLLGPEEGVKTYLSEQASNRSAARSAGTAAANDYRDHLYKMQELRFTSGADYEKEVSKTLLGIFGDLEAQDRDLDAKKQMNSANNSADITKANISAGPHYFELQQRKEAGKRAAAAIRQFGKGAAMENWEIEYYANKAQADYATGHTVTDVVQALKDKTNKGSFIMDPNNVDRIGDPTTPQKNYTENKLPMFSNPSKDYSGGDQ